MSDWNIFGTAPESLAGLLGEQATQDLKKKAMTTGLINTALGYLVQPKNQNLGLGRIIGQSLMSGMQGAQGVYTGALDDWQTKQKIAELQRTQKQQAAQDLFRSRIGQPNASRDVISQESAQVPMAQGTDAPNFQTQMQAPTVTKQQYFDPKVMMNEALQSGALPFDKYLELQAKQTTDSPIGKLEPQNFTPESWNSFIQSGYDTTKLRAIPKQPTDVASVQEFEMAKDNPQFMNFLKNKWTAQAQAQAPFKTAEQQMQERETDYKYGTTPTTSATIPRVWTAQDIADTAASSGKTITQVQADLKKRGIKVKGNQ
jgi:hypothetical protein